jgi:hypothetical protein
MKMRRSLFRAEEPEWLVWLLVAVMLGIGLIAKTAVLNRTSTFNEGNVSVVYPAGWMTLDRQDEHALLSVGEPFDSSLFPARFSLLQMPAAKVSSNAQSLGDYALTWSDDGAQNLLAYKVLEIAPIQVRGRDAVRVDYVYVAEPALATPNSVPVVARGSDVLILNGENMTVARLVAQSDAFDGLATTWDRVLGSLELR